MRTLFHSSWMRVAAIAAAITVFPVLALAQQTAPAATKVDINNATPTQLETLPGVGAVDGQENHRRPALHGRWRSVEGWRLGEDDSDITPLVIVGTPAAATSRGTPKAPPSRRSRPPRRPRRRPLDGAAGSEHGHRGAARDAAERRRGDGEEDHRQPALRGRVRPLEGGSDGEDDHGHHAARDGRPGARRRAGHAPASPPRRDDGRADHNDVQARDDDGHAASAAGQGHGVGEPVDEGLPQGRRPLLRQHEERQVHERGRRDQGRLPPVEERAAADSRRRVAPTTGRRDATEGDAPCCT